MQPDVSISHRRVAGYNFEGLYVVHFYLRPDFLTEMFDRELRPLCTLCYTFSGSRLFPESIRSNYKIHSEIGESGMSRRKKNKK